MRLPILFLILTFCLPSTLDAAKIQIDIIDGNQESLIYYTPFDGEYYYPSRKEVTTDETGKFIIEKQLSKPGFFYIFSQLDFKSDGWNCIQVYVTPDANISIQLEKDNPDSTLAFYGDHLEINNFLSLRERHYFLFQRSDEALEKYSTTTDPDTCYNSTNIDKNLELQKLSKIEGLDSIAKEIITGDINLYYQTAFLRLMTLLGKDENASTYTLKPAWLTFLNASDLLEDPGNLAYASTWYPDHLQLKTTAFRANNPGHFEKAVRDSSLSPELEMYSRIFTADEFEKVVGELLYRKSQRDLFNEKNMLLYQTFKEQFPSSPYIKV